MADIVVVGAGISGLSIGILAAQAGHAVLVLEAQQTPSREASRPKRSINFAMSARGLAVLRRLGLEDALRDTLVPMFGRRVHQGADRGEFHRYDLIGTQAIHSIKRARLTELLENRARATPGLELRFDRRCISANLPGRILKLADSGGRIHEVAYDALIGADGAHSPIRNAICADLGVTPNLAVMPLGYKELTIPSGIGGLDADALHVWPAEESLLVALPNRDGSFTCTLFSPLAGPSGFPEIGSEERLTQFFDTRFPGVRATWLPDLPAQWRGAAASRIVTVKCPRWASPHAAVLIGDAAHAMAPFYGQGMNCALEDCLVLSSLIVDHSGGGRPDWGNIFTLFENCRIADATAIADLSDANFADMNKRPSQSVQRLKRDMEAILQRTFPDRFIPLYARIAFSNQPYAEAVSHSRRQDEIVNRLAVGIADASDMDLGRAAALLSEVKAW